mmetsp:Transcript_21233/g.38558  ORF Transcript_21233/g.38558 Transcript_21233/m.38558 type:complete len:80 (+) Transcript_21233:68-307(+)
MNPAEYCNMQDMAATGCGCRRFCTTPCPDRVSNIDPELANETVFFQFDRAVSRAKTSRLKLNGDEPSQQPRPMSIGNLS